MSPQSGFSRTPQKGDEDKVFGQPLKIRHVQILGNQKTQPHIIEQELQEAYKGATFREVSHGLMRGLQKLQRLDIFEAVEITCSDVDPDTSDGMQCTDLLINIREKGPLNLKAETYVEGGGSEGGVESSVGIRNVFGTAEKIQGAASFGTRHSNMYKLELVKPRVFGLPMTMHAAIDDRLYARAEYSSYDEKKQDATIFVTDERGRHNLGYSASWRDIMPVRSATNQYQYDSTSTILSQAKPSLKSSILYAFNFDNRDSMTDPNEGTFLRCETELAGLGGDVAFAKGFFLYQNFYHLGKYIGIPELPLTMSYSLKSGLLYPLSRLEKGYNESCISDRFWLGGPLDLRGFKYKGAGPRSPEKFVGATGGDSLGGDITWSICTSILFPLFVDAGGLKGHLFFNTGNLTEWGASFRTIAKGARASCGAGLILPTPIGRLEATYSHILRANKSDQTSRFQIGIGIDFT